MRCLVFLLAVVALLVAPSASSAGIRTVVERQAVAWADEMWPQSSCRGRVVVRWVRVKRTSTVAIVGEAFADCSIHIARTRRPDLECMVLMHELGHLAGAAHDPSSPLMRDHHAFFAPCRTRFGRRWLTSK